MTGIFTLGFSELLYMGLPKFKKYVLYKSSSINEATHYWIKNSDKTYEIVISSTWTIFLDLKSEILTKTFYSRHLNYYYDTSKNTFQSIEMNANSIIEQYSKEGIDP